MPLKWERIAPGIELLEGTGIAFRKDQLRIANAYRIDSPDGTILVEPHVGMHAQDWIRDIEKRPMVCIFVTHYHGDHSEGAHVLASHFDVPLYSPKARDTEFGPVGGNLSDDMAGFRAIHTPGHSPHHVVFYRDSDGLLISGDMIDGDGGALFAHEDQVTYVESLKRLVDLRPRTILPGHGHPILDNTPSFLSVSLERFR